MKTIFALSGFLGQASDWNFLIPSVKTSKIDLIPILPQFGEEERGENPFLHWASDFNRKVEKTQGEKWLIGYSLGGRLAIHALLEAPHLWQGAILISCNPGLKPEHRAARMQSDAVWSDRFKNMQWNELLSLWSSQDVFGGQQAPERQEENFCRKELQRQLLDWSPAKQEDLTEKIAALDLPILWVTGEQDVTYSDIAKRLSLKHPLSEKLVIHKAGHRIPWEEPEDFILYLDTFMKKINESRND